MSLIVACGLQREAAIIGRRLRDCEIVAGGGDSLRLERALDDAAALFPGIVLSFGIAGALDPNLRPGDLVIDGERSVLERLRTVFPAACVGAVAGSATIVATAGSSTRPAAISPSSAHAVCDAVEGAGV